MDVLFGIERTMLAGIISLIFALLAAVVYTHNMLRGERPSLATWLVWGVVGVTAFFFHYEASDGWASRMIPLFYAIVPFWYLALVRYFDGMWSFNRREKVSLGLAFVVWGIWIATHYFKVTFMGIEGPLFMIVAVDVIGVYTAIEHARKGGEYVNRWSWLLTSVATTVGVFSVPNSLFAIEDWLSPEMIYPSYLALAMPLIFAFTWYKPVRVKPKYAPAPRAQRTIRT